MDAIEYQWLADFCEEKFAAFKQFIGERTGAEDDDVQAEANAECVIGKLRKLAE
jgi:hypothetical protein